MEVFVANLDYAVSADDLRELFADFRPTTVRIALDRESGRSRGFAFLAFFDPSDAERAIERFDGESVWGRRLVVKPAHPRESICGPSPREADER